MAQVPREHPHYGELLALAIPIDHLAEAYAAHRPGAARSMHSACQRALQGLAARLEQLQLALDLGGMAADDILGLAREEHWPSRGEDALEGASEEGRP